MLKVDSNGGLLLNQNLMKFLEKLMKFNDFALILIKSKFCNFWIANPTTKFSDRKPPESHFRNEHDSQIWNLSASNLPNRTSKSDSA